MKALSISHVGAIISLAVLPLPWKVSPGMAAGKIDTARIEQFTGAKGQFNEKEGVFKVNVPRTDLNVTVDPKEIADIVGTKSELNNGVYKITLELIAPAIRKGAQRPPTPMALMAEKVGPCLKGSVTDARWPCGARS